MDAGPAPGTPTEDLVAALRGVFGDVVVIKRELARQLDASISPSAFGVLGTLRRCGPSRVSRLAEVLHVDVSVISRHVRSLELDGLVERRPDPRDRRACAVVVTPAGEAAAEQVTGAFLQHLAGALDGWSADDLTTLRELLERLHADLGRCTSPTSEYVPHATTDPIAWSNAT